jgi:hypothetical protein
MSPTEESVGRPRHFDGFQRPANLAKNKNGRPCKREGKELLLDFFSEASSYLSESFSLLSAAAIHPSVKAGGKPALIDHCLGVRLFHSLVLGCSLLFPGWLGN